MTVFFSGAGAIKNMETHTLTLDVINDRIWLTTVHDITGKEQGFDYFQEQSPGDAAEAHTELLNEIHDYIAKRSKHTHVVVPVLLLVKEICRKRGWSCS